MTTFYVLCAGIITASVVVVAVYAVGTLAQIRATARAVEYLAINANEKIEATRGLFEAVNLVSNSVRSIWFKVAQMGFNFLTGFKAFGVRK